MKAGKSKPSTTIEFQLLGLPEAKIYPMKNIPHGLCVIINNIDFTEARAEVSKDFSDRRGSEIDTGVYDNQKNEQHTHTYTPSQKRKTTTISICSRVSFSDTGRILGYTDMWLRKVAILAPMV